MVLLILAGILGLAALGLIGYVVYSNMAGRSKIESTEEYVSKEPVEDVREEVREEETVPEPALAKPSNESEAIMSELSSLKSIHRALQAEFENYKKNNTAGGSSEEIEKLKAELAAASQQPEDSAEVSRLRSELNTFEKLATEKNASLEKAVKEAANWQAKFKETLAANEASSQEIAALNTKLKDALAAKDLFTKEKEEFAKKSASLQTLTQEVENLKKQLAQKDDDAAKRSAAALAESADSIKALKEALAVKANTPQMDPAELEAAKKSLTEKDALLEKMKIEIKSLQADPVELETLRKQAADKDIALAKLSAQIEEASKQKGVSQEEYNKIKAKLEAAEKVLRVVHGAA